MKKLLFSAILMIAFSVSSFAGEKITNDSKELKADSVKVKTETVSKEESDGCTTIHLRWNDATSDGNGGMILTYHRVDIEICDDGNVTITG